VVQYKTAVFFSPFARAWNWPIFLVICSMVSSAPGPAVTWILNYTMRIKSQTKVILIQPYIRLEHMNHSIRWAWIRNDNIHNVCVICTYVPISAR